MKSPGAVDYSTLIIGSLLLAMLLTFLGVAFYYGRKAFFGSGDEVKKELARKKREMEMYIEMQRDLGRLPAEPPKPAESGTGPNATTQPAPPAKKERVKEQWEIEAEESEYHPE